MRAAQEETLLQGAAERLAAVRSAHAAGGREIDVLPVVRPRPVKGAWAEWETGPFVTHFIEKIGQVLAREQTQCRLRYDRKNLYVIFRCEEPRLDQLRYCPVARDGPVWDADDVEVFIDANNDKNTYYLFGTDSTGNRFDMTCSKAPYKQDIEWSVEWDVHTGKGEDRWYAALTIPLAAVGLVAKKGDSFGISLNRARYAGTPGIPSGWPNGKFHHPAQFGKATFR